MQRSRTDIIIEVRGIEVDPAIPQTSRQPQVPAFFSSLAATLDPRPRQYPAGPRFSTALKPPDPYPSRRAMSKDRDKCAYCDRPASTRDHVPPESLFTPPRPINLITVPACGDCNQGASDDDEVFRNELSIMAGSFRESANAAERLEPTERAILRNKAMRQKMVHAAKPVERYSMGGIYLGRGYAVPLNSEAHRRVLTRIVRGLYWHQTENSLGNDVHVELMRIDKTTPNWQEIFDIPRRLRLQNILVGDGDTFQYFWGNARDDPTRSVWILMFFKGPSAQIILVLRIRHMIHLHLAQPCSALWLRSSQVNHLIGSEH
jgi:hypothetical protein